MSDLGSPAGKQDGLSLIVQKSPKFTILSHLGVPEQLDAFFSRENVYFGAVLAHANPIVSICPSLVPLGALASL